MIQVTKPFLPPIEEYKDMLDGIWSRNWLTNNGPLVNTLELNIKEYLDLPYFLYLNNGTIAIQLAIKALELKGEIITTPFSFVATTSTIVWEGCTPVYADIDKHTLNIDPAKIESMITDKTCAILATHVYGNPCDIDRIQEIADKHKLKVIYDGAHCFGTTYKGKSVFAYGDITTVSLHATKIFHTIEGGGVFANDPDLIRRMALLRNFGHSGYDAYDGVGINGKNSEYHAAMGIINLKYVDSIIESRKKCWEIYCEELSGFNGRFIKLNGDADFNAAYFPIIFDTEEELLKTMAALTASEIGSRRYFYPSLNMLDYVTRQSCPVAEDISVRVLCLPLYYNLTYEEIKLITRLMLRVQNN
jgi:dTDP-4-amino-4,6-dideoxygalactose transaminase